MMTTLNRRAFLRTAGISLALPYLESLHGKTGGDSSPPKRMVIIGLKLGIEIKHTDEDAIPIDFQAQL